MKICNTCKIPKKLSEFYKHPAMADGRVNECKSCRRLYSKKYTKDNIDRYVEYRENPENKARAKAIRDLPEAKAARSIYSARPDIVEAGKVYAKSEAGVKARRRSRDKLWRATKATNALNHAVTSGKLIRPNICENCPSSLNIHGHHDDYSKPLDVRWLCSKCHVKWHCQNTPLNSK